ncbi:hypothetical protein ACMAUO_00355 [Gluconacetobacter sp. Hr-1-5]|uniref:hypothetical protein n=1 Tax=Gluconacetobacter sp. Hr-1-5 TaxID=3395370 RepID=UPI003B5220A8
MMTFTHRIILFYLAAWLSMLIFVLFFYDRQGVFTHFLLPTIRSAGIFFVIVLFYTHVLKRERRLIKLYRRLLHFRSFQFFLLLFPALTFASLGWDVAGSGHPMTSPAFLKIFSVILSVLLNEYLSLRGTEPGSGQVSRPTSPSQ